MMRKFLKHLIRYLGYFGLTDKFFKLGMSLARYLLPEEAYVNVGNYVMCVNPKVDVGYYLGYDDVEPGIKDLLLSELNKKDVFYDIGAYLGYYTLLTCDRVSKVVAFEPDPLNYRKLYKNIIINNLNNVIVENLAISDFDGIARFQSGGQGSRIEPKGSLTVKTVKLDSYVQNTQLIPDFIKIDVEGHEYKVLRGGLKTLSKYNPKLLIEVHLNTDIRNVYKILKDILNYEIFLVKFKNSLELIKIYDIQSFIEIVKNRETSKYGTYINVHVFCI